jgi:hypothetical protein
MPSLRYLMLRLYGWKMLQVYDRRKAILVEGTDSTPPLEPENRRPGLRRERKRVGPAGVQ